jgi:hypothetical protein
MKFTIKQFFLLAVRISIQFLLLTISLKFFTYLLDPYSYSFASFVNNSPSLNKALYKKFVLGYGQMLYNQEVISILFFLFFLFITIFFFIKSKQSTLNYFLIIILLILIERLDLTNFNNPKFLGLIPEKICGDMKSYLLINGIAFLFLGIIFFLINFRICFLNKLKTNKIQK